jgi:hypothetical protein
VRTVGALVLVIGISLIAAGCRSTFSVETAILGIGTALSLAAVDIIYVARRVIAPIYLLDAAVEIALILLWIVALAT